MARLTKNSAGNKSHFRDKYWFFLGKVTAGSTYISGGLLLFVIVIICLDLVLRNFFQTSIIWTSVTSGWAILFVVFLSAPWVLSQKGHVRVDLVDKFLSPQKLAYLKAVTLIAAAGISAIFLYYISLDTWKCWQRGTLSGDYPIVVPRPYIESVIVFGYLLLIPYCLRQAWEQIQLLQRLRKS